MKIKPALKQKHLFSHLIDTPLGTMIALADHQFLYSLQFSNTTPRLSLQQAFVQEGITQPIEQIKQELSDYFQGILTHFATPLFLIGTPFQQQAWKALRAIPYGQTISYSDQSIMMHCTNAHRAAALANAANLFAIIIPCHRVIAKSGKLSGYAGGINRKEWLLQHERKYKKSY